MFRKHIFLGLMILLGAVLVWLFVKSPEEESESVAPPAEVVRTVKPSRTRAIYPPELEISNSEMELAKPVTGPLAENIPGFCARHEFTLRNNGLFPYHDPLIQITYLGRSGESLESRSQRISVTLPPGQTASLSDIIVQEVPPDTASCTLEIVYSDFELPSPQGEFTPK